MARLKRNYQFGRVTDDKVRALIRTSFRYTFGANCSVKSYIINEVTVNKEKVEVLTAIVFVKGIEYMVSGSASRVLDVNWFDVVSTVEPPRKQYRNPEQFAKLELEII